MSDKTDEIGIDTPDGPMSFATKGKDLPVTVTRFTDRDRTLADRRRDR